MDIKLGTRVALPNNGYIQGTVIGTANANRKYAGLEDEPYTDDELFIVLLDEAIRSSAPPIVLWTIPVVREKMVIAS